MGVAGQPTQLPGHQLCCTLQLSGTRCWGAWQTTDESDGDVCTAPTSYARAYTPAPCRRSLKKEARWHCEPTTT
jgi:hypothetical protein